MISKSRREFVQPVIADLNIMVHNYSNLLKQHDYMPADCSRKGIRLEPVQRRRSIGVGHDAITFSLEKDGDRSEDIALVVDESDGWHEPLFWQRARAPRL
jgi:hypothetical protein